MTFSTTSTNSAARTVSWQASDGVNSSNTVTSTVDIASTPPVLAGAGNTVNYTLGGTAQAVDAGLTVADTSSPTLAGATVSISGGLQSGDALNFTTQNGITGGYANGVLTLTGSASLANYQTALNSVTFSTTSTNAAARTVTWKASDGVNSSNTVTSTVDIASTPPVLAGAGNTVNYTLGGTAQAVDAGLTVADTSSATLSGATVSISGGLQSGDALNFTTQNGITGSYANGVLTLSGSASLANYQTALDSVTFSTTSTNSAARTVSWKASDGLNSSNTVTSTVDIASTPPVLAGAGNTVSYTLGGTAQAVDAALTVSDTSSATLSGATVSIGGFQSGDQLNFTNQNGITGSYGNGVLTLSGAASLANYQTALDSVTFSTTSTNTAARTVSWQASDPSGNLSNAVTSTVNVATPSAIGWTSAVKGSWNTASDWNPATVPGAANQANISVAGTYTVTSSQSNSVGSLNITDPKATLAITSKSTLNLGSQQASVNAGTISLAPGSQLNVTGTINNSGTLKSQGSAIGQFGTIENGIVVNTGTIEASVAGAESILQLQNVTINQNSGGSIEAASAGGWFGVAAAEVALNNAVIEGGTLYGGPLVALFETLAGSQSNLLDGTVSPLTNDAALMVADNSSLTLKGTITNRDAIDLFSVSHPTNLQISGNVTLNGGGYVFLANKNSSIAGTGPGATLTNVNDTIYGAGSIGNSQTSLVNGGAIYATNGTVTINTGSNTISNSGTLGSAAGDLIVDSSVSGSGLEQVIAGGTLEFGASVSSGQTVTFSGLGDTLLLDHAESFAGTVAGLATRSSTSFDAIDLADFKFANTSITSVTGTGAKGTTTNVTLKDSSDGLTTTLHLLNQYANQFAVNAKDYSLTSANPASQAAGTIFSVDNTLGIPNRGIGH